LVLIRREREDALQEMKLQGVVDKRMDYADAVFQEATAIRIAAGHR
jgi:hypothetical protein